MEISEKFPLKMILELHKEIEKAFRDLWSSLPTMELKDLSYDPPADVEDLGDKYVVKIDLPGFKKQEIKIKVGEDYIQIRAEKGEELEEVGKKYIIRQRVYKKAVKGIVFLDEVTSLLDKNGALYIGYKNKRGLIGAAASIAWNPVFDKTYELITYRKKEKIGSKREIEGSGRAQRVHQGEAEGESNPGEQYGGAGHIQSDM